CCGAPASAVSPARTSRTAQSLDLTAGAYPRLASREIPRHPLQSGTTMIAALPAQREALPHQVLRDLPQTLGSSRVESVRLDAVEGIRRVVHRRHVAVLEIDPTAPLELRRSGGEHRGRSAGLDGLELHSPVASLEELQVLRLQMSPELGEDRTGMQPIGVHA